uniref:Uncharacterized protein n=2 Tax=Opuntia streptacantha TaxID=393608 RepID=A0A7C8YQ08_OPUST
MSCKEYKVAARSIISNTFTPGLQAEGPSFRANLGEMGWILAESFRSSRCCSPSLLLLASVVAVVTDTTPTPLPPPPHRFCCHRQVGPTGGCSASTKVFLPLFTSCSVASLLAVTITSTAITRHRCSQFLYLPGLARVSEFGVFGLKMGLGVGQIGVSSQAPTAASPSRLRSQPSPVASSLFSLFLVPGLGLGFQGSG